MRLTVLGCGTAKPRPETPASGLLVESDSDQLLLDCGPGVANRLAQRMDPRALSAIVVSHLHADHYLDLAGLRYLFPWAGHTGRRVPVYLPPGGLKRIAALCIAISERPGFFDDAFDLREYEPTRSIGVGDLQVSFVGARHYVPAWSIVVDGPAGTRLVYGGDTGPSERLLETARTADLLVLEATFASPAEDEIERGHLTAEEAIDIAAEAEVPQALLVHYPADRRAEIDRLCAATGRRVVTAEPLMTLHVAKGDARGDSRPRPSSVAVS